jgi:hypothetical protein
MFDDWFHHKIYNLFTPSKKTPPLFPFSPLLRPILTITGGTVTVRKIHVVYSLN